MIFETRCAGCDRPGAPICRTCRFALLARPPADRAHGVIAALPFSGRARDVILGFKYRNRRQVGRHLGGLIVNRLAELGAYHDIDLVTWAPTGAGRRSARGFDQGEIIARTVARQLGVPCRRMLERRGAEQPQTGLRRTERLAGPDFVARPDLAGRTVLVVDDVVTTGATLRAAGEALREQGATPVLAAVAATPERRHAHVHPLRRPLASTAA
jgi:predicted amidophosphoribosyltransferase